MSQQPENPLITNEEIIEQLVRQGATAQQLFGPEVLIDQLKKRLAEKVLNAEMEQHLREERALGASGPQESDSAGNHRNGYSPKTVLTESSKLALSIPRDRAGTFAPKLIAKYRRRLPGFDDKVLSMYARGAPG